MTSERLGTGPDIHEHMKRLGLLLLLGTACDLEDKDIGDSGNVSESNGDGGEGGSESDGGSGDEGQACTLIGCDDGIAFQLRSATGFVDGDYQVDLGHVAGPDILYTCEFSIEGGQLGSDSCLASLDGSGVHVFMLNVVENAVVTVLLDGATVGSYTGALAFEPVYPNGPDCGVGCEQAQLTLDLDLPSASSCEDLGAQYAAEVEAIRGCTEASECGQVLEGTSCGCTRNWVARNDADLTRFDELVEAGTELACEWAAWGSTCDCPEVDGYACVDNVCTWNYL